MSAQEKKTILLLLVEDEIITAAVTSKIIQKFGFNVITANNGAAAVEIAISNEKINLVLMDIDLGEGIDGPEAARRILEKRNIPIVFLTAHTEPEYVERVKEITRYGYVIKNSGNFVLRSSIEMAFELFDAHMKTKEKEHLYLLTLESIPDTSILLFDHELRYQITGGDEIRKSGFDKSHIVGKTLQEAFPESVVKIFDPLYKKALAGEKTSFEMEYANMAYYQQVIPVYDLGGDVCNGMVVSHNITERKLAEDALRESEESLSITLQSIGDGVIATDTNGLVTRMNDTAERLTGWNFIDAKNKPLSDVFKIISAGTRNTVENPVQKVLESGKIEGLANHTILISRDGFEYQIADSAAPIRDKEGNVKGVILVFSDVTEKYKASEKLKESEEKFIQVFENITEGVARHKVLYDSTGEAVDYVIEDVNRTFESITGLKSAEIVGKKASALYGTEPPPYLDLYAKVAGNGHPECFETVFEPMRKCFNVSISSPAKGYFTTVFADITERKLADKALKTSLEEKETLLRELYHRTKNNMQVISSMLALQAIDSDSEKIKSVFKDTIDKIKVMSLVHEKLYQSKDLSSINLKEYIGELIQLFIKSRDSNKTKVSVMEKIDNINVLIDTAIPCGLIISELISNSLKHAFPESEEGKISISLSKNSEGILEFCFSDNGCGFIENFDIKTQKGIGLKTLTAIAKNQLKGNIEFKNENGFVCIIRFSDNLYKPRV